MSRRAKLKKAREKMLRKYPREAAKWWRSKIEEAIRNANPTKEEEERKPSQRQGTARGEAIGEHLQEASVLAGQTYSPYGRGEGVREGMRSDVEVYAFQARRNLPPRPLTEMEKYRLCYSAARTAKPLWCCPTFRKLWYETTGERITTGVALVDINTGRIVGWADPKEEK